MINATIQEDSKLLCWCLTLITQLLDHIPVELTALILVFFSTVAALLNLPGIRAQTDCGASLSVKLFLIFILFQVPELVYCTSTGYNFVGMKALTLKPVSFVVNENTPTGTVVGQLSTFVDDRWTKLSRFTMPENPFFGMDPSGSLYVIGTLDRDANVQLCSEANALPAQCIWTGLVVTNAGEYISLRVTIADVNDNPPVWSESYISIDVREGLSGPFQVELPKAVDLDFGENAVQRYRLVTNTSDPDAFRLHVANENGLYTEKSQAEDRQVIVSPTDILYLQILKPFDREKQAVHTVKLLAIDGTLPYNTGTLLIRIHVKDENDQTPAFTSSLYTGEVFENAMVGSRVALQPGTSLRQLNSLQALVAVDQDEGVSAEVEYTLAPLAEPSVLRTFTVERTTGVVRLSRTLSSDKAPREWRFEVIATDNGKPRLSASTFVHIYLRARNTYAPEINVRTQTEKAYGIDSPKGVRPMSNQLIIPENRSPPSLPLAIVTVSDRDSDGGGQFECSLAQNGSGDEHVSEKRFRLNYTTQLMNWKVFHLYILCAIDLEVNPPKEVYITCKDQGTPMLSSRFTLEVLVLDENDNAPVFSMDTYIFNVRAGSPVNSSVGKVMATDADRNENARVSYSITWSDRDHVNMFWVDSEGYLWTSGTLDGEAEARHYCFVVVARDNAIGKQLSSEATVEVSLIDCVSGTDRPRQYNFSIDEDYGSGETSGRWVGDLTATDCDFQQDGDITYWLLESGLPFQVTKNGSIYTVRGLDREKTEMYHATVVVLDRNAELSTSSWGTVEVTDHPEFRTSHVSIRITVNDLNDNRPEFIYPNSSYQQINLSIHENQQAVVMRFIAVDKDFGNNGRIRYSLLGKRSSRAFHVVGETGELVVGTDLKTIMSDSVFLKVEARDQGDPPKSTALDLEIRLQDVPPKSRRIFGKYRNEKPRFAKDRQFGKLEVAGAFRHWSIDPNQLIILATLVSTAVICIVLVMVIWFFVRRKRCFPMDSQIVKTTAFKSERRTNSSCPEKGADKKSETYNCSEVLNHLLETNAYTMATDICLPNMYNCLGQDSKRPPESDVGASVSTEQQTVTFTFNAAVSNSPDENDIYSYRLHQGLFTRDTTIAPHEALILTESDISTMLAINDNPVSSKYSDGRDGQSSLSAGLCPLQHVMSSTGVQLIAVPISSVNQPPPEAQFICQQADAGEHQLSGRAPTDLLGREDQRHVMDSDTDSGRGGSDNNNNNNIITTATTTTTDKDDRRKYAAGALLNLRVIQPHQQPPQILSCLSSPEAISILTPSGSGGEAMPHSCSYHPVTVTMPFLPSPADSFKCRLGDKQEVDGTSGTRALPPVVGPAVTAPKLSNPWRKTNH